METLKTILGPSRLSAINQSFLHILLILIAAWLLKLAHVGAG